MSLSPPVFQGDVLQCEPVTVSWTGGEFPVRVEAFYQEVAGTDWRNTGVMPAEAASTNSIEWFANIPAGSIAWITLVDHTGTYRQSSAGAVVGASSNSSCLSGSQTADVVTQTVFMNESGRAQPSLNDRSLLILCIVFGVLALASIAGILYMWSLLRHTKRARQRGARFDLADEDAESVTAGPEYAAVAARSRKTSAQSDTGTPLPAFGGAERGEKQNSRTSTHSDRNPFRDPPSPTRGSQDLRSNPAAGARDPSLNIYGSTFLSRPPIAKTTSAVDTLSSATSMQLFGTGGGLRVINDPNQISTPQLSRYATNTTQSEQITTYPASESEYIDGSAPSRRSDSIADDRALLPDSESGHSMFSNTSSAITGSTADHYATQPHSSGAYLSRQQQAK